MTKKADVYRLVALMALMFASVFVIDLYLSSVGDQNRSKREQCQKAGGVYAYEPEATSLCVRREAVIHLR